MKKILIIYATAGEGHKRAAFAIKDAFDHLNPADAQIKTIDVLDYTNNFFKKAYLKTYISMVTYVPTIWGFFYYLLDFKWLYPFVKVARRVVNKINAGPFEKFLCNFRPDIVISTHFLPCEVISNLKKQGRLDTKLITCITDFRMHSFWFSNQTDSFCVGFSEARTDLIKKWNCPAKKISILGIPVHSKFYEDEKKKEIYNKLNLSSDLFTILITGGGFGVGPILSLVKLLISMAQPFQVLVVCGHNADLRKKISKLATVNQKMPIVIKSYGFIDYVDELMTISSVAITKAGGLICSEALAKKLPLIIIAPIPGQEGRNCRLLLANNAAFKLNSVRGATKTVGQIYNNNNTLKDVRQNIKRIRCEDSGINVAKLALRI